MDDVIASIKEKVEDLYPDILTDLNIDEAYLTEIVEDVVDRALIYMNRDQLVTRYEDDLEEYPVSDDDNDEYWKYYPEDRVPIPARLYRVLARVVVQSAKTILNNNVSTGNDVASISDNGQSISYRDSLTSFFSAGDDSKVFSGSLELLKNYRLASVPDETNNRLQRQYQNSVL